MSITSILSSESFRVDVSLLIFNLKDLSSDVGGMINTMIILLTISPLIYSKCFLYISVLRHWVHTCLSRSYRLVSILLVVERAEKGVKHKERRQLL